MRIACGSELPNHARGYTRSGGGQAILSVQAGISRSADGSFEMLGDADHPVWLCLLGYFRLLRNGELVAVRSGGKTEALLAHLGLGGRYGVPRDVLLRAIWPNSDTALAAQALNSLVHSLRSLLGEALSGATPVVQTGGHYRLNEAAGVAVDVARFKGLVSDGERCERAGQMGTAVELYEQAVRLYGGDLSAAAGGGARVALERERLRASCRRALIHLADYAFAREDFGISLAYALELLEHDPCCEDAHRLVMRCHVRLGERSQALYHYRTVQTILRSECDAEPEPATTALFEQIRLNPNSV
jgi:DNA-binding SARP family transcriptional activator